MSGDAVQPIDVTKIILETANSICSSMLSSIDSVITPLLDKTIFIDEDITKGHFFLQIFGTSPSSGILLLANCLLFAFILYYCIRLVSSHFSGEEVESPYRFFLRAILAAILMNSSLEICNIFIKSANLISDFFCDLGYSIFKKNISFTTLISTLNSNSSNNFSIFSIEGILTSMLSMSSLALLLSFSLRYILIQLLIIASPFAFLCVSNKSTEGFLKSWYRALLSMLLIQILISALLIIPHALLKEDASSIFNKVLLIGSISALLKSSQLVKEFLGGIGISSNFQAGISGIKSMISR